MSEPLHRRRAPFVAACAGILGLSSCGPALLAVREPARLPTIPAEVLPDSPSGLDSAMSNDLQGVTHDERFWYFSQAHLGSSWRHRQHTSYLWTLPVSEPLSAMNRARRAENPWRDTPLGAFRHLGAVSFQDGFLFVALTPGYDSWYLRPDGPGAFGVIDARRVRSNAAVTWRGTASRAFCWDRGCVAEPHRRGYLAAFSVEEFQRADVPWVAVDPRASECKASESPCAVLYSSPFGDDTSRKLPLHRYRWTLRHGLEHLGEQTMEVHGGKIQGGAISEQGILYLASDGDRSCGIQLIDLSTTRLLACVPLDLPRDDDVEVEGLTLWDLDRLHASDAAGQLHLLWLDNDVVFGNDDVTMKHLRLRAR